MLRELHLRHFRNYDSLKLEFSPGVNCLLGDNGQGKTNLLEAIYFLSLLRSFRTADIQLLRQWNAQEFLVSGVLLENDGLETMLSIACGQERHLKVNETPVYRFSDFINRFLCVTLIPQDLMLVQGTPAVHRKFLDIAISQQNPAYLKHLQAYVEALKSRNAMLKQQEKFPRNAVSAFDAMLAREGAELEVARQQFACLLNQHLEEESQILFHGDHQLKIHYMTKISRLMQAEDLGKEELEAKFRENLERTYPYDCMTGTTSLGPQRADFHCLMDGVRMADFSSQGECRMASLALRLCCLRMLSQSVGLQRVTLLIDDVLGELDTARKSYFFQAVSQAGQIFFAGTALPDPEILPIQTVFHIRRGTVT